MPNINIEQNTEDTSKLGEYLNSPKLAAVVCGLVLHFLFNRFEKRYIVSLKRLLVVAPLLPTFTLWFLGRHSSLNTSLFGAIFQTYIVTYGTLISSIIIYRLSPIHPLAKYPGPLLARCSKFWAVFHTRSGRWHHKVSDSHRKYGPVVRIGPNEVSFCDVDAVHPVLGANGMAKGPFWDGRKAPSNPYWALIGIRDSALHLQRRKVWGKGLNVAAVHSYEPALKSRVNQLVDILHGKVKQGVAFDIAELVSFFSYDFMGDMAFGGGFTLLTEGDREGLWKVMESGIRVQAYTQHVPWASPILYSLPGMGNAAKKFLAFMVTLSQRRIKRGTEGQEDLSSYLLDEGSPTPNPPPFGQYVTDALLAVVAGADTVATAVSCVFYYILTDKSHFMRLRKEIDERFPLMGHQHPLDDMSSLGNLPYLDAVLNEALRLQPPVPTGLQRASSSDANENAIGSHIIPRDTAVLIPPYAIHRDPRYFSPDPDRFWPDRWIIADKEGNNASSTVKIDQGAFIPYSAGPMNCAGKLLAQLELRAVVATLVYTFDMDLEPSYSRSWENDLEDYFVLKKGVLPIIVKERM